MAQSLLPVRDWDWCQCRGKQQGFNALQTLKASPGHGYSAQACCAPLAVEASDSDYTISASRLAGTMGPSSRKQWGMALPWSTQDSESCLGPVILLWGSGHW